MLVIKEFKSLGYPVLIGTSRKSFIGMISDIDVGERLEGSIASALWSAMNSADILRVHDVSETKKALQVIESIQNAEDE